MISWSFGTQAVVDLEVVEGVAAVEGGALHHQLEPLAGQQRHLPELPETGLRVLADAVAPDLHDVVANATGDPVCVVNGGLLVDGYGGIAVRAET